MLLGSNPNIPPTVQSKRIYRNDAIFVRQFVEPSKPLHIGRVLIHAMQQDHHWIVLLGIVALGQPDHEATVHIVDRDFLRRFLRPQHGGSKEQRQAACRRKESNLVPFSRFHHVSRRGPKEAKQSTSLAWKHPLRAELAGEGTFSSLSSYHFLKAISAGTRARQ